MQNHRIFVEALHAMRDELRNNLLASDRALVPPIKTSVGATGMEFLTEYKLYTDFVENLRGFWSSVKSVERAGGETCEEFLQAIGDRIRPTSPPSRAGLWWESPLRGDSLRWWRGSEERSIL
jgi:hypothetical protein